LVYLLRVTGPSNAKLKTGPITKRGAKQLAVWILVQIPM